MRQTARTTTTTTLTFIALVLTVVILIGLASPQVAPPVPAESGAIIHELSMAVDYLVVDYDSAMGLVPETPNSSVYWLYSDNFLAPLALSQYGRGNATLLEIAANISATVSKDSGLLNGPRNQYTALEFGPCQFSASQDYTILTTNGIQIKVTLNNGTRTLSDSQYADIAFLSAACLCRQGDMPNAFLAYNQGVRLFDGVGFRDLPYNETGEYQTYKLALFVYASVIQGEPISEEALSTLLAMQAPSRGFYTGYDAAYSHEGTVTNTETTSLAILALSSYSQ